MQLFKSWKNSAINLHAFMDVLYIRILSNIIGTFFFFSEMIIGTCILITSISFDLALPTGVANLEIIS